MNPVTIVIPNKDGQHPMFTLESLYRQEFRRFDIIIVNDHDRNACKARNEGLAMVKTEFVLFSDNDIAWEPNAIFDLYYVLKKNPGKSYSYGWYLMNGKRWCDRHFDASQLRQKNYIDTGSLVRTADHPGWDESIKRLQDWDVWLTMLKQGKTGIYTETKMFTKYKHTDSITSSVPLAEARQAIVKKHRL